MCSSEGLPLVGLAVSICGGRVQTVWAVCRRWGVSRSQLTALLLFMPVSKF